MEQMLSFLEPVNDWLVDTFGTLGPLYGIGFLGLALILLTLPLLAMTVPKGLLYLGIVSRRSVYSLLIPSLRGKLIRQLFGFSKTARLLRVMLLALMPWLVFAALAMDRFTLETKATLAIFSLQVIRRLPNRAQLLGCHQVLSRQMRCRRTCTT